MNNTNWDDFLWRKTQELKEKLHMSEDIISIDYVMAISLYIQDMRVLKNIINEFVFNDNDKNLNQNRVKERNNTYQGRFISIVK